MLVFRSLNTKYITKIISIPTKIAGSFLLHLCLIRNKNTSFFCFYVHYIFFFISFRFSSISSCLNMFSRLTHEVVSQILQKSLRRVKEVWNNADGTTIFDLKRSPCRVYPFELYLNLFLMCAWLCFYFLSLFYVLFVARAFSYFLFARACIIVMLFS